MIFTALSFYGLFTAYFLYEEVMSVRLYVNEYRCLKLGGLSNRQDGCSFQQVLRQNLSWFLS